MLLRLLRNLNPENKKNWLKKWEIAYPSKFDISACQDKKK